MLYMFSAVLQGDNSFFIPEHNEDGEGGGGVEAGGGGGGAGVSNCNAFRAQLKSSVCHSIKR